MKITGVNTYLMRIPLITPFKTALRTVDAIEDVVVELLTDEGAVGYGEAPPTAVITGDTLPSIAGAVTGFIVPKLLGRDVADIEGNCLAVQASMVHNTSPKAAVEMALYDLYGKALGAPLYRLLGGAKRSLATNLTISVDTPDKMAADAAEAVRRGFRVLKVKLGSDPSQDIARLKAVQSACPKDMVLRADANQGWTPREALRILGRMREEGIELELVEQPVKAWDVDGLRRVTAWASVPVLADESVFTEQDAARILSTGAADMVNIKLMKTGGLSGALRICAIAETHRASCMMGCMLEGNVAVTAAAHLAMAKDVIRKIDLDGPALCRENPVLGGAAFDGPNITLPEKPGLGIEGVEGLVPYRV